MALADDICDAFTTNLKDFKGGVPETREHLNQLVYVLNVIREAAEKNKGAKGDKPPHFIEYKNEAGVLVAYNTHGQRADIG